MFFFVFFFFTLNFTVKPPAAWCFSLLSRSLQTVSNHLPYISCISNWLYINRVCNAAFDLTHQKLLRNFSAVYFFFGGGGGGEGHGGVTAFGVSFSANGVEVGGGAGLVQPALFSPQSDLSHFQ